MLDYQRNAIYKVSEYAKNRNVEQQTYIEQICKPFDIDNEKLVYQVKCNPITINFHPDRFSNNGKTIMENLLEQGQYHGQFRTGTTNGGKTAHIGGNRFLWEQQIFFDSYPPDSIERPKYGGLNLFNYIDGACARFGSCFFVLKHHIINRCTFAYGDSSTNPTTLCTSDTFNGVLAGLLNDVKNNSKMLNQIISSFQEALAILLNPCKKVKSMGRNLDYYIETHIHGDIMLKDDVDSFYIDESYQNTIFAKYAETLCQRYEISLKWIPIRQIDIITIGELFRGPMIPPLAKKIDNLFGDNQGIINAALIGQASRDSTLNPKNWYDIGNESDVFQYIKQLWHTVGYFG